MADPAIPLPSTAQEVATTWVEAVMDHHDLDGAWPLTDPTLRLVLVQDWIWAHRHHPWVGHGHDWDVLARSLAAPRPDHHLWPKFSAELLELWHKIWSGFSALTWKARDNPEVVDLDLETVTFVEADLGPSGPLSGEQGPSGPLSGEEGPSGPLSGAAAASSGAVRPSFARRFALRHSHDGWQVASINGDQMFIPGWPPSMEVRSD